MVVRALPFNSGFLDALLSGIEADKTPEELVPGEIVFTAEELERDLRRDPGGRGARRRAGALGFFLGQLDFCRMASPHFESKSKDTLKLAGQSVGQVCNEECPLDKKVHLCTQTENGVSVRAYQTALHFAKALAYFRGHDRGRGRGPAPDRAVGAARQAGARTRAARSSRSKSSRALLQDRVAWIRHMFDMALEQLRRATSRVRKKVRALRDELDRGARGRRPKADAEAPSRRSPTLLEELVDEAELSGPRSTRTSST